MISEPGSSHHNKTILITGGNSGIGLETAKILSLGGTNIVIIGRNSEKISRAVSQLPVVHENQKHFGLALDLTLENCESIIVDYFKTNNIKLSGAVLAAGVHSVKPFALAKAEHFSNLLNSNFLVAVNAARAVTKSIDSGGGAVIFVSSVAAIRGGGGVSGYSAAKAAIGGLMRTLAIEYAQRKIRFNSVLPGVVKTEMTEVFFKGLSEAQRELVTKSHPLGLGSPRDVAAAISFLLSNEAQWITGTELIVDGGLSCHS